MNDPISRDMKRLFGIMERGRPMPAGPTLLAGDRFALVEGLKTALPDERRAVSDYQFLAEIARRIGQADIAFRLENIARQEQEHHSLITEMLGHI